MVRGNLQTFDAAGLAKEVPIVTTVSVWFSKNALGGYKPHEKAEFSSTYLSGWAGGVIKSVPKNELQEVNNKLGALKKSYNKSNEIVVNF